MNEKKYVEVNDLLQHLPDEPYKGATRRVLQQAPAADVAPVIHAKWDANGRCTNCGGHAPFYGMASTYYKSPYCFECGAKMDEECK